SGENCISCVLRSGRQNAVEAVFFQYAKTLREDWLYRLPLIEPKIIDEDEEQRHAFLQMRQHFKFQKRVRHYRTIGTLQADPVCIVAGNEFIELGVSFALLALQHFPHFRTVALLHFRSE